MASIGITGCSNGVGTDGEQTKAITRAIGGPICPAVGADTDCGIIITITNTGSTITFTGQGPYDTIEDTLVGVVNNSDIPIRSIGIKSALQIFGFDADGICGLSPITGQPYVPGVANCPFGPTGYEGPGVSFAQIDPSLTSGTVNFATPLVARGGTAFFSLEESITSAHSCPDVINNAVTPAASGANIDATFTPNLGLSLQAAAPFCGFVNFDWVQIKKHIDDPTFFSALNLGGAFDPSISGPVKLSSARLPYHDPPQGGGYTYNAASPDFSFPFYYDARSGELQTHETGGLTLTFHDAPGEPCLPGGFAVNTPACNNTSEPAGSFEAFTTHLAGVNADGTDTDLGVGFNWQSTYNGTTGGVAINKTDQVADGNGTGGVTITSVQTVTNYQYNGIVVTTLNGTPIPTTVDNTPPTITAAATPSILWPPDGKLVAVTVSGTIQDDAGGSGVDPASAAFAVVDEYGQVQPAGHVTVASNGSYSFTAQLQASRNGNDRDGRLYVITVSAHDNAGNSASATANVTVPHDQGR